MIATEHHQYRVSLSSTIALFRSSVSRPSSPFPSPPQYISTDPPLVNHHSAVAAAALAFAFRLNFAMSSSILRTRQPRKLSKSKFLYVFALSR